MAARNLGPSASAQIHHKQRLGAFPHLWRTIKHSLHERSRGSIVFNSASAGSFILYSGVKSDRIDARELGKASGRNAAVCKLLQQLIPALARNTCLTFLLHPLVRLRVPLTFYPDKVRGCWVFDDARAELKDLVSTPY